ncbi:MAG TPA: hypothetical protein VIK27_02830 [Candidatus Aquilonibacter sp.]
MKLPYRAGDSFALPLGDGTHVPAHIVACDHHTVDIVVERPDGEPLPVLRASDRALVLQRWRRIARGTAGSAHAPPGTYWTGPAKVERTVATLLGRVNAQIAPLRIHEGRFSAEYPCVRGTGELAAVGGLPLRSLIVAGPVGLLDVARAFPELRHLRIAVRGMEVDARMLRSFSMLQTLNVSGVTVTHVEALAALEKLAMLRLARIDGRIDLRDLADLPASALSFEAIRELRGVDALLHRRKLEQLELLDMWQLELGDVMPLCELPHLLRAQIDVGGRRKNVELYRRAAWAYPWPRELCAAQ